MPSLPIPIIGSLFLGFLFVSILLRRDRSWLFAGLLALCALQGVVISLAQHYGVSWALFLQPVSASLIPPMAWITLQGSAIRRLTLSRDFAHILGPMFSLFCVIYAREFLNLWIPALFAGYGIAIFVVLSKGADALPQMRLSNGGMSRLVWQGIAASLLASALSDVVIVLAQMIGLAAWQPWVVSVFATLNLLIVGALSLSESLSFSSAELAEQEPKYDANPAQDADIMARLEGLVTGKKLFLDSDLTLGRLSRKLGIPVKHLSGAINRSTGENVSRYINKHRIEAACQALAAGDSVTQTLFASGFNTKSNFNREFLRIKGIPPKEWLAQTRQPQNDTLVN